MNAELKRISKIIGISISTFGTLIGLYQWWSSKSELSFSYKTIRLNDYIESNPYTSSIKFNINGKNYDSIFISHIKIENVGSSDIRKDDYEGKPIKFLLSKNLNIIEVKDFDFTELFNPKITFSSDTIMMQPILFKKEFIVEFDLISLQPITSVKSLSLIAGLDLISTKGFNSYLKNKTSKTTMIIDNIIKYASLFFYTFLAFILFEGSGNVKPYFTEIVNYRPTKWPYMLILIFTTIMALFCFVRLYLSFGSQDMIWILSAVNLGLLVSILFKFNQKGTLHPFEELK